MNTHHIPSTQGPWYADKKSVFKDINDKAYVIAVCEDWEEETEANADLIAAAPDMLAALRRAVLALAFAAETSEAMRDDYEAVSAAIAKATGADK